MLGTNAPIDFVHPDYSFSSLFASAAGFDFVDFDGVFSFAAGADSAAAT
jgi:hypothetical protein